jgi:hypothetical protein
MNTRAEVRSTLLSLAAELENVPDEQPRAAELRDIREMALRSAERQEGDGV